MSCSSLTGSFNDVCNLSGTRKWYVLYTRPNFEKIIHRNLKELGFHSYLPLQKELRQWKDRKVIIETPLFRSYVFIKTSWKKKNIVYSVKGILNFVHIGSQLAVLSDDEIERIEQLCLYNGKINIEFERLKIGKKVEICSGVLKGLKGILTEVNNSKRVHIHLEGLNSFASVQLNVGSVSLKYIS